MRVTSSISIHLRRLAKVSEDQVPVLINQEVGWLQVSMDYIFVPEIGKNLHNLSNVELPDFVCPEATFCEHLAQVSVQCVVQHEEQVPPVHEGAIQSHNTRVRQLPQDHILVSHLLDLCVVLKQKCE